MPICTITNTAVSPRTIHDASGKPITIAPGQTKSVNVTERAARRYERDDAIKVYGGGEQAITEINESTDGDARSEKTGAELITDFEEKRVVYAEFLGKAKTMLGDQWPGGTPKKSAVYDLLKEHDVRVAAQAESNEDDDSREEQSGEE